MTEKKELKVVKEQLKKWNDENLKRQDEMQLWIDLAEEQRKKYRSTLEDIKEIVNQSCDNCKCNKDDITCSIGDCSEGKLKIIENKINEVLE